MFMIWFFKNIKFQELNAILTIDCPVGKSLLYLELQKGFDARAKTQKVAHEEEQKRQEQESLIKEQMEVSP